MFKNIVLVKAINGEIENDTYFTFFKDAGYSVSILQPIEFEFCNVEELAGCLKSSHIYSGLILTSPRSVASLKSFGNLSEWAQKDNYVVGDATLREAKALNLNVTGQESGSASNLCEIIKKGKFDKPFLYPKSNLASDTIENVLTSASIHVYSLETYRTIPSKSLESDIEKLKKYFPAAMIFFSPSGVNNVLPFLKHIDSTLHDFQFFAIGETTEKALKDNDLKVTGTALKPSPNSLLATVKIHIPL